MVWKTDFLTDCDGANTFLEVEGNIKIALSLTFKNDSFLELRTGAITK